MFLWHHITAPSLQVVSGLARLNNFGSSRRFREDGREALKLATGGGALGVPVVAKRARPVETLCENKRRARCTHQVPGIP